MNETLLSSVVTDSVKAADSMAMLSLADGAAYLDYSVSGLRKLIKKRLIRYSQARPHADIKFRREWLDEFIDEHSVAPGITPAIPVQRKRKTPSMMMSGVHVFDPSLLAI